MKIASAEFTSGIDERYAIFNRERKMCVNWLNCLDNGTRNGRRQMKSEPVWHAHPLSW